MLIRKIKITTLFVAFLQLFGCGGKSQWEQSKTFKEMNETKPTTTDSKHALATFGAGCFWCTEAVFQQLKGVEKVESGYEGGFTERPSYKDVCTGATGHAEVTQITYDPSVISFDELLAAFWTAHDPTTLNRQGNDAGTQYRSVIFYHNEEQKKIAASYKKKLNEEQTYGKPVVTEISPATTFYKAEDYHQNYFNQNGHEPYCTFVVRPKVEKFKEVFKDKLKAGNTK